VCSGLGPGAYDYRRGADPVGLPFEDRSFDAVLSIGVLEHVRETGGDEIASLREIRRILRPGGFFICVHLPNRFSWIEFLARALGRSSHRFSYTRTDILRLSGNAGLRVIEIGRYGALPRNLWSGEMLRTIGNWVPAAGAYQFADSVLSRIFAPCVRTTGLSPALISCLNKFAMRKPGLSETLSIVQSNDA
jgi:SAM-dependent methyltransferase